MQSVIWRVYFKYKAIGIRKTWEKQEDEYGSNIVN